MACACATSSPKRLLRLRPLADDRPRGAGRTTRSNEVTSSGYEAGARRIGRRPPPEGRRVLRNARCASSDERIPRARRDRQRASASSPHCAGRRAAYVSASAGVRYPRGSTRRIAGYATVGLPAAASWRWASAASRAGAGAAVAAGTAFLGGCSAVAALGDARPPAARRCGTGSVSNVGAATSRKRHRPAAWSRLRRAPGRAAAGRPGQRQAAALPQRWADSLA